MKKIKKAEMIPILLGAAQLTAGCLIGGFIGGAFFGGGLLLLITYTIGKYLYDRAEKRRDSLMKSIFNLQKNSNDGNND